MIVFIDGLAPTKALESDAAYDLRAEYDILVNAPGISIVPCGLAIAIPRGHVGLVCSRSGLAINHGIFVVNAPGIIDPGYKGEVCVLLGNFTEREYRVHSGDRIAQLLIVKTADVQLVQNANAFLAPTDRGLGGFGSTGR